MSEAFITGSHAYGKVHPDSDIDLVIRCTEDAALLLAKLSDPIDESEDYYDELLHVRFGKLNVLICTDDKRYEEWKEGTEILKQRSPVSRDDAVEVFREIRAYTNIPENVF